MSGINLEEKIAQLEFKYGGVLQKLAELHDAVVNQLEEVKTAGVKIRREKTSYISGTVLACVGRNNGNKFLKAQNTGTTGEGTKDESFYDSLAIDATWVDGGVTWKVVEDAFTSGNVVESALVASHASNADFAGYADSAGYAGPFHVIPDGESEPVIISGVTYGGISFILQDDTRPAGTAGVIVDGTQTYSVPSSGGFLPEGKVLYLHGTSTTGGQPTYNCEWYIDGHEPPSSVPQGEFLTALAKNEGGITKQMQFGDIVTPWPGDEEEYNGPFKVESIGSATEEGVLVRIYDSTGPVSFASRWGGRVFAGEEYYKTPVSSGRLRGGDYLYLVGDSKNGTVSFDYTAYIPQVTESGGADPSTHKLTITSAGFYVRLAKNMGGKIVQIQHGDITIPPWKVESATHATYADYANVEYNGPFKVEITASSTVGEDTTYSVKIYDPTDPSTSPYYAGRVFDGSSVHPIESDTLTSVQSDGFIYLNGSSGSTIGFSKTSGTNNATNFSIKIAQISEGKVNQIQFGDIYSIPWNANSATNAATANYAATAGYADSAGYAEYYGPFNVSTTAIDTTTNVATVTVIDNTRTNPQIGGCIVLGNIVSSAPSSAGITLSNGYKLYLVGSSGVNGYDFSYSSTNGAISPASNTFWTQLAHNIGGKVIQTQFGDIVQPEMGVTEIIGAGGIQVDPADGKGKVTLTYNGGGGADFPQWNDMHSSGCEWESNYIAPVDGWIVAMAEIYNNGQAGEAKLELTVGGEIFIVNKLTASYDIDIATNHSFVIQVASGCPFQLHVTQAVPNPFIIGQPGTSNGRYAFFSNSSFQLSTVTPP